MSARDHDRPDGEGSVDQATLFGVPIVTVVRPNLRLGGHCVKSGTEFTVRGEPTRRLFGFSFVDEGESLEQGIVRSRFELLERMFSRPSLYRRVLDRPVDVLRWQAAGRSDPPRSATVRDLCLRPGMDSTGIAIHTQPHRAHDGAVCELVERHLLGELWYERSLTLARVPSLCTARLEYRLSFYSVVAAEPLPLLIAVVTEPGRPLAFCGSALAEDASRAARRAAREALMLLDGYIQGDQGQSNSPHSARRLTELGRGGHALLAPLLDGAGSVAVDDVIAGELRDLAPRVMGAPIDVASMEVRPGLHLSRALCESARTLPEHRHDRGPEAALDPFC